MSTATTGRMISLHTLQCIPYLLVRMMGEGVLVPFPEPAQPDDLGMTVASRTDRFHPATNADVLDQDLGGYGERDLVGSKLPRFVVVDPRVPIPGWRSVEYRAVVPHLVTWVVSRAVYHVDSDAPELVAPVETSDGSRDGSEYAVVLLDRFEDRLWSDVRIPDQVRVHPPQLMVCLLQIPSRRLTADELVPADRRCGVVVNLLCVSFARSVLEHFDVHLGRVGADSRNRRMEVHSSEHRAQTLAREDRHVVA